MKLETFFEKFDQFADALDAVVKMRELVLELAVQGRLVEQKPAEGDGHALLRQIHKKNPPSVTETDVEPMDSELASFPSSWAPSKLGEVAEIIRGVTFPGSAKSETPSNGDVACLRTASVQAEIDWDDLIYISPTHVSREDQWVIPNDIMISMANSYALVGKVAIVRKVPQRATFGAFLAAIRPVLIEPYFLLYVLRSPRMQAAFRASSSQTTNIANISLGRMRPLPFPLPPLAEQKRIVAKVDELMALCDRLEAQQQERETRHAALTRASLARFADAPTPANLPFLFHPSYPISPADLRKSILTLAVQGKLVPQDPNDEPALVLLKQIATHKAALAKEGKLRGSTAVRPMADDEVEFELPSNWCWVRFGEIMVNRDGERIPVSKEERETKAKTYDYYGASGVIDKIDGYLFDKPLLLIGEDGANLINRSTPIAFIARGQYWVNNHAHVLDGISEDFLRFIELHINAINLEKYVTGSAQPKMNQAKMNSIPIALPPLAEQRRIVAKVDQLMALVDELETQLAASRTTGTSLMAAVIAELTAQA